MNTAVAKIPDERESFGPCMLACRPDEREFVLHVIAGKSNAEAAKLAGWGEPDSSANTMSRIGHRLAHRDRIIAAIGEEVKKLTRSRATLKAAQVIDEILNNSSHTDAARVALSPVSGLNVARIICPRLPYSRRYAAARAVASASMTDSREIPRSCWSSSSAEFNDLRSNSAIWIVLYSLLKKRSGGAGINAGSIGGQ